jgi:hypothetical protein
MKTARTTERKLKQLGLSEEVLKTTVNTLASMLQVQSKGTLFAATFSRDLRSALADVVKVSIPVVLPIETQEARELPSLFLVEIATSIAFSCQHIMHITAVLAGLPSWKRLHSWCRVLICCTRSLQGVLFMKRCDLFNQAVKSVEASAMIALSTLLQHPTYFDPATKQCKKGYHLLALNTEKVDHFAISMGLNTRLMKQMMKPCAFNTCPDFSRLIRELALVTFSLATEFVVHWAENTEYQGYRSKTPYTLCIVALVRLHAMGMTSVPQELRRFASGHDLVQRSLPTPTEHAGPDHVHALWLQEVERSTTAASFEPATPKHPMAFSVIPDEAFDKLFHQALTIAIDAETRFHVYWYLSLLHFRCASFRDYVVLGNEGSYPTAFRVTHKMVHVMLSRPELRKNPAVVLNTLKFTTDFSWGCMYGFPNKPFYGAYCPVGVHQYWNLGVGVVPERDLETPLQKLRDLIRRRVGGGISTYHHDPFGEFEFFQGYLKHTGNADDVIRGLAKMRPEHRDEFQPLVQEAKNMKLRWSELRGVFVGVVYRAGVARRNLKQAQEAPSKRRKGRR